MNKVQINNYKPKDFSKLLNVSVKTLQRWDNSGILKAHRSPTNRRYYTYDQYLVFKGIKKDDNDREIVINENLSSQEELVQDIISMLDIFSSKLHGLDKYKKQIREDNTIVKKLQD